MIGKINNIIQFHFIDQSTTNIILDPQPDDAIWCDKVSPDCSKEFALMHCRKYCQSTYDKSKSILELWWLILKKNKTAVLNMKLILYEYL